MGYFLVNVAPEVPDEAAAQALLENRLWTMRIGLVATAIALLMGYGVFYPGRSWAHVGVAALSLAVVLPVIWLIIKHGAKPERYLESVRAARANRHPVQIFTRPGLVLTGLFVQAVLLVLVYMLATTPV